MHKILVVEDDKPILEALVEKLGHEGYQVLQALDGQAGLEIALKEKPGLILLDIVMPVMDGITMLQQLRQDPWGQLVPVLILTNLTDSEKMKIGLQVGASDYLIKSNWKLEEVMAKIKAKMG